MAGRLRKLYIEEIVKHLPPSASTLRLLDVDGAAGDALREARTDLEVVTAWEQGVESVDAVVAYGAALDAARLSAALSALRPGGRLIMLDPDGEPQEAQVQTLEGAGYTRILVGPGLECPTVTGVLMRGEKPHTTEDTHARVQIAARQDDSHAGADLAAFNGRYVHLLVRQSPNKPVWALKPDEVIEWKAAALTGEDGTPTLLAFSSLPRAVAFMQPAVLRGAIKDVSKVAKFSKATAQTWTERVLLNPDIAVLDSAQIAFIDIDPATAETPDE